MAELLGQSAWERACRRGVDLLVIGAGATGCGVLLDAASRGLSVACCDAVDVAAGASSASTKLLHGGVRYLEKAVKDLDAGQFRLVQDGLRERALMLRLAPHLCRPLTLLTPVHDLTEGAYLYAGLRLYDTVAGRRGLGRSRPVDAARLRQHWPQLASGLAGGVLYRDGRFDDARLALAIAQRAVRLGGVLRTHCRLVGLQRAGDGLLADLHDGLGDARVRLRARVVINATGAGADRIRQLYRADADPLLRPSAGAHLVFRRRHWPHEEGLLIPRTGDGRVLFCLPWQGRMLAGTTDVPYRGDGPPTVTVAERDSIIAELNRYLRRPLRADQVRSSWTGLRPLVAAAPGATAQLSRDHLLVSEAGLVSIVGGKWTTWRLMARDAVDAAVREAGLAPRRSSRTHRLLLGGAVGWCQGRLPTALRDLPSSVAGHLHRSYGSWAPLVVQAGAERLFPDHPYIAGELRWAIRHEGARSAEDILARRLRLAHLDARAAESLVPVCVDLLATELGWTPARKRAELQAADVALRGFASIAPG